ncbi:ketosteroid isomerase-like protein [Nocardioides sp. BE266]|nr:ketosteroid isomerase-like protein [Nocardioides sp. BE266]
MPDFRAELLAHAVAGDDEWGEVDWSGRHVDGSAFAMRGVIIVTVRDGRVAAARLYVEPVEADGETIEAAIDSLYRPPR